MKPVGEMTEEEIKAEKREQRLKEHTAKVYAGQVDGAVSELRAMEECVRILNRLPQDSQKRALRWVADRLDNFEPPIASFYGEECPF